MTDFAFLQDSDFEMEIDEPLSDQLQSLVYSIREVLNSEDPNTTSMMNNLTNYNFSVTGMALHLSTLQKMLELSKEDIDSNEWGWEAASQIFSTYLLMTMLEQYKQELACEITQSPLIFGMESPNCTVIIRDRISQEIKMEIPKVTLAKIDIDIPEPGVTCFPDVHNGQPLSIQIDNKGIESIEGIIIENEDVEEAISDKIIGKTIEIQVGNSNIRNDIKEASMGSIEDMLKTELDTRIATYKSIDLSKCSLTKVVKPYQDLNDPLIKPLELYYKEARKIIGLLNGGESRLKINSKNTFRRPLSMFSHLKSLGICQNVHLDDAPLKTLDGLFSAASDVNTKDIFSTASTILKSSFCEVIRKVKIGELPSKTLAPCVNSLNMALLEVTEDQHGFCTREKVKPSVYDDELDIVFDYTEPKKDEFYDLNMEIDNLFANEERFTSTAAKLLKEYIEEARENKSRKSTESGWRYQGSIGFVRPSPYTSIFHINRSFLIKINKYSLLIRPSGKCSIIADVWINLYFTMCRERLTTAAEGGVAYEIYDKLIWRHLPKIATREYGAMRAKILGFTELLISDEEFKDNKRKELQSDPVTVKEYGQMFQGVVSIIAAMRREADKAEPESFIYIQAVRSLYKKGAMTRVDPIQGVAKLISRVYHGKDREPPSKEENIRQHRKNEFVTLLERLKQLSRKSNIQLTSLKQAEFSITTHLDFPSEMKKTLASALLVYPRYYPGVKDILMSIDKVSIKPKFRRTLRLSNTVGEYVGERSAIKPEFSSLATSTLPETLVSEIDHNGVNIGDLTVSDCIKITARILSKMKKEPAVFVAKQEIEDLSEGTYLRDAKCIFGSKGLKRIATNFLCFVKAKEKELEAKEAARLFAIASLIFKLAIHGMNEIFGELHKYLPNSLMKCSETEVNELFSRLASPESGISIMSDYTGHNQAVVADDLSQSLEIASRFLNICCAKDDIREMCSIFEKIVIFLPIQDTEESIVWTGQDGSLEGWYGYGNAYITSACNLWAAYETNTLVDMVAGGDYGDDALTNFRKGVISTTKCKSVLDSMVRAAANVRQQIKSTQTNISSIVSVTCRREVYGKKRKNEDLKESLTIGCINPGTAMDIQSHLDALYTNLCSSIKVCDEVDASVRAYALHSGMVCYILKECISQYTSITCSTKEVLAMMALPRSIGGQSLRDPGYSMLTGISCHDVASSYFASTVDGRCGSYILHLNKGLGRLYDTVYGKLSAGWNVCNGPLATGNIRKSACSANLVGSEYPSFITRPTRRSVCMATLSEANIEVTLPRWMQRKTQDEMDTTMSTILYPHLNKASQRHLSMLYETTMSAAYKARLFRLCSSAAFIKALPGAHRRVAASQRCIFNSELIIMSATLSVLAEMESLPSINCGPLQDSWREYRNMMYPEVNFIAPPEPHPLSLVRETDEEHGTAEITITRSENPIKISSSTMISIKYYGRDNFCPNRQKHEIAIDDFLVWAGWTLSDSGISAVTNNDIHTLLNTTLHAFANDWGIHPDEIVYDPKTHGTTGGHVEHRATTHLRAGKSGLELPMCYTQTLKTNYSKGYMLAFPGGSDASFNQDLTKNFMAVKNLPMRGEGRKTIFFRAIEDTESKGRTVDCTNMEYVEIPEGRSFKVVSSSEAIYRAAAGSKNPKKILGKSIVFVDEDSLTENFPKWAESLKVCVEKGIDMSYCMNFFTTDGKKSLIAKRENIAKLIGDNSRWVSSLSCTAKAILMDHLLSIEKPYQRMFKTREMDGYDAIYPGYMKVYGDKVDMDKAAEFYSKTSFDRLTLRSGGREPEVAAHLTKKGAIGTESDYYFQSLLKSSKLSSLCSFQLLEMSNGFSGATFTSYMVKYIKERFHHDKIINLTAGRGVLEMELRTFFGIECDGINREDPYTKIGGISASGKFSVENYYQWPMSTSEEGSLAFIEAIALDCEPVELAEAVLKANRQGTSVLLKTSEKFFWDIAGRAGMRRAIFIDHNDPAHPLYVYVPGSDEVEIYAGIKSEVSRPVYKVSPEALTEKLGICLRKRALESAADALPRDLLHKIIKRSWTREELINQFKMLSEYTAGFAYGAIYQTLIASGGNINNLAKLAEIFLESEAILDRKAAIVGSLYMTERTSCEAIEGVTIAEWEKGVPMNISKNWKTSGSPKAILGDTIRFMASSDRVHNFEGSKAGSIVKMGHSSARSDILYNQLKDVEIKRKVYTEKPVENSIFNLPKVKRDHRNVGSAMDSLIAQVSHLDADC